MKSRSAIRLTRGEMVYQASIYGIILLLLLISLFPLLYVVCLSFASQQEIYRRGP